MTKVELTILIAGCLKHSRISQKIVYLSYYGFALPICKRYITSNKINDLWSFQTWFHRIVINTAIDRIRHEKKLPQFQNTGQQNINSSWNVRIHLQRKINYFKIDFGPNTANFSKSYNQMEQLRYSLAIQYRLF